MGIPRSTKRPTACRVTRKLGNCGGHGCSGHGGEIATVKTVLVLGASVSQVAAIRTARRLGLRVIAVDGDPNAIGFAEADVAEAVDFSDLNGVIEVARRHRVDGVVAISTDRAVPVAAAVAEQLGLAGIGTETAEAVTDKGRMRRRLAEAGSPQPSFVLLKAGDDPVAALESVGTPAVLKPVDSGGQRGLFMIETPQALWEHLPSSLAYSRSGRAILEPYIAGSELNVMAVVMGGEPHILTLSDRLRPPGPGFGVGWAHLFPSQLPLKTLDQAAEVAREAIRSLGLRDGIAFPQLLATEDEVFVVEVAARIAAGQMADLVRLGVGVDLIEIALLQALGQPVGGELITVKFRRPLAIRFLTASPGPLPIGRLRSIEGLDLVCAAPGVLEAGLYLQPGETIKPVQVDADRRGFIVATGSDPRAALMRADEAATRLKVTVAPPDE